MSTVIRIAFAARWRRPVHVEGADLLGRAIKGPGDALRHMQEHFRHKSGPLYWSAFNLCHSAIRGEVRTEQARPHFVAACAEDDARDHLHH
ncbi:DUF982 domain-containing protein [Rhizobiaceae bacterium LC148]|nr:DUF982 domain-containing protein [Rhizobiaceae bacterium LC148]